MLKECIKQHTNPATAKSMLADLPIGKPRNSYTSAGPRGFTLLEGEDGSLRSDHRFCFSFFKLGAEHVNMINAIMLDNSHTCQTIAFTSRTALKMKLEHYVTLPVDKPFKIVGNKTDDPMLSHLLKLEKTLRELGSNKDLVYNLHSTELIDDEILGTMGNEPEDYLSEQPTKFMQLYMKLGECPFGSQGVFLTIYLGGSAATLRTDMDQVNRMIKFRIKIDVWTKGLEESIREDIRRKLGDLFCHLPSRRLWFYLKRLRLMSLNEPESLSDPNRDVLDMDGPEDVIIKGNTLPLPLLC